MIIYIGKVQLCFGK